jgi:hypothetical protein
MATADVRRVVSENHLAAGSVIQIPLSPIEERPPGRPRLVCGSCGGQAFVVHQRVWKRIRDPHLRQVLGIRYRCKRCARIVRCYPIGAGDGRQSDAVREMSVLLYCVGLTYGTASLALQALGCGVSPTTVRHNMEDLRSRFPTTGVLSRLHLDPGTSGTLRGPDGGLTLRVDGTLHARSLIVTIDPGSTAADLRWRFNRCARSLTGQPARMIPPGKV